MGRPYPAIQPLDTCWYSVSRSSTGTVPTHPALRARLNRMKAVGHSIFFDNKGAATSKQT